MAFDIEGARKEGYSDSEIADYLAQQKKFDLAGARKEGYSDAEIISHLGAPKPTEKPKEPQGDGLLKKFVSGAASIGDIVAGAPAFAVGAVGAPLVSTYEGLVEGKSPKEAAQAGRQFAADVTESKWGTPFKSALEGAGYFSPEAYEQEATRQAFGKVGEGIEYGGQKLEEATGGAIPKEQTQMIADLAMLAGIPGGKKVGKIVKEKLTEPTARDIAAEAASREQKGYGKATTEQDVRVDAELAKLKEAQAAKQSRATTSGISEEPIPVTPEGQAIVGDNMEFFKKQAEERQVAAQETARTAELAALDETMMQHPENLQAPQYGLGGKIARHEDQVSRVKNKFEPGERVDQIHMDLERERFLREEQQKLQDENAAWEQRQRERETEQGTPLSKEDALKAADERRIALEEQQQRQAQLDRIESELAGVEETLLQEPTVKVGQGPKTREARMNELTGGESGIINMRTFNPVEAAIESYKLSEPALKKAAEILDKYGEEAARVFLNTYYDQDRLQKIKNQENVAKAVSNINKRLGEEVSAYKEVTLDDALTALKNSKDSNGAELGFFRQNVLSRGRIGFEKIKNEGLKAGLAYMVGLRDEARVRANKILHGPDGIMTTFRKLETLLGPGRAAEVLRQRQEAQFNPDYKFKLDPEQMKAMQQLDTLFENVRQEMEKATGKPVKKIPNYFPSMFFGSFAAEIRDANGRLVGFITENSKPRVRKAVDAVLADLGEGFTVSEPKYRRELTSEAFRNKGGLAPYFETMMDLLGSDDPVTQRVQEAVQTAVAKRAMDTKRVSQRFEHKAGVLGAQGEQAHLSPRENYNNGMRVLENYVRAFEDWKANQGIADFLNQVGDEKIAPNSFNTMTKYFDDLRPQGQNMSSLANRTATAMTKSGYDIAGGASKGVSAASSGLTKLWLGFWNLSAGAQNVLSPVHAFTKLVDLAANGGSKDVISPLIIGMAKTLNDMVEITAHKVAGTKLGERAKYQLESEVIKPGLVTSESRTKLGDIVEKGVVSGGLLATEAFARSAAHNIFTEYFKNSGYSEKEAMSIAKNMAHDYMVNYEDYAKPGMLANSGIIGNTLGRLQSFKINQFTQLANYFNTFKKTGNPLPMATALAVSIGMAGTTGMIGMDVAEGLYGLLVNMGAVDPSKVDSPRQIAMDSGGAMAVGVPTAASGKWLSGSLSSQLVGDVSWRSLAPVLVGMGQTVAQVPTLAQMGYEKATGQNTIAEQDKGAALMAVTPASMRGMIEERYMKDAQGNIVSPKSGQVLYTEGPQDQNLLSKFTNVRSRERGETMARSTMLQKQEDMIDSRRSKELLGLKKMVDEDVRGLKPMNEEQFTKKLQEIIDLGGDPNNAMNAIVKFAEENQRGDWLNRQIMSGNVTLSNLGKKQRALRQRELIGK